jgi:fructokinase
MVKILCCGTVMADILAVNLEKIAKPGEVIYLEREIETRIGGHPINVAIDLVKLGKNSHEIGVIAALGKGMYGDYARKIIEQYKLQTFFQNIEAKDTGKNIILELEGEDRRFHIDPGANWDLSPEFVKTKIRKLSPKIFCVRPGYCGIDLHLEEIFQEAKNQNSFIFLDIMEPHPERPKNLVFPVLPFVDTLHCNEKEAMLITGKSNSEKAIKKILKQGVKTIFLTKGERGAELITNNFRIIQQGFKVNAIDATGCGDAFCAGVVHKLIEYNEYQDIGNLSPKKMIKLLTYALAVGSSAATAIGCTEGVSKEKVNKILKEGEEK